MAERIIKETEREVPSDKVVVHEHDDRVDDRRGLSVGAIIGIIILVLIILFLIFGRGLFSSSNNGGTNNTPAPTTTTPSTNTNQ